MMRCLEFYSGIGGLHYSLVGARKDAVVVAAFDVNPLANAVYEYNHGLRPIPTDIGSLSARALDAYRADTWVLSPPCQPYTRQGHQRGSEDPRAESFIKLLEKLEGLDHKPKYLLVENVVGFEESATRSHLAETMRRNGYITQEFLVSPLELGIPYSRARYFCLAKLSPARFPDPSGDFRVATGPPLAGDAGPPTRAPLRDYLLPELDYASYDVSSQAWSGCLAGSGARRYLGAVDIVSPLSRRCCCFTKSYSRYLKGTGSLIAANAVPLEGGAGSRGFVDDRGLVHIHLSKVSPEDRENLEKTDDEILDRLVLRYFTPREVANLHSFPQSFGFPDQVTKKQRYSLLGNSLSVAVVTHLLEYLFDDGA